jgi:glycosyltransferase involved in cell wall biosynthesis
LFGSTPAVGFLGNLKADKGLRLLLDAWRKTNDLPELVIMGEGVMRDEVESAAATRDYASLVTYLGSFDALGRASALEKFFSRINYLLVPTVIHGEGMPNVIVEALRHGVPVIATNLGGVAAFAEPLLSAPPHVCLLCGPGEIIDTIRRIGSLRGHNNDVASQCRAYYRQWFDDKPVMERWDNAIVFGGNTAAS